MVQHGGPGRGECIIAEMGRGPHRLSPAPLQQVQEIPGKVPTGECVTERAVPVGSEGQR